MALAFDGLVELDDNGRPHPRLALSWQHDAAMKHWEFRLRPGVKFHDGAPLTPAAVVAAVQSVNPDWHLSDSGAQVSSGPGGFAVDTEGSTPDLPLQLANARNSIIRRGPDGALIGTGPFRIARWEAGRRAIFAANEEDWEGRPYLDAIEVQMGRPPQDQLIDLQVGKADLVEVPPEQVRRAAERGARISTSAPVELLALAFVRGRAAAENARVREALGRAIDRAALWNFLLQKQGEPAGGLLPQWSSGTAFLFSTAADPGRARQLASQISPAPALTLGYDAADPLERVVAERIVVNAREAGISISTRAAASAATNKGSESSVDGRLLRVRIPSPEPRVALTALLTVLTPLAGLETAPLPDPATPEEIYAGERAAVETLRVVPLAYLPEAFGLSPRVKDWTLPRSGAWRLAEVWLEAEAP